MIKCRLGDKESFGAGIIFGYTASRIYIATANHVVRQGIDEAKNVRAQFRWLPGESIDAKLLEHVDSNLDLAVLVVTDRVETDLKSLPFDQLGDLP
jgi:S1-C subfamily serine protease